MGVVTVGSEILVNTTTTSNQFEPKITTLSNGGFVITWTDWSAGGGDASQTSIRAQVFNAASSPVGSEILVNTATQDGQYDPQITALPGGGFVITWHDYSQGVGGAAGDAVGAAVKAQLFAADGTPVGTEILVNTATADIQREPQITALSDGGFAVTWWDRSQGVGGTGGDASVFAVKAQVFAADGSPVGNEIRVNTATAGDQDEPVITALSDGGFVVAWSDESQGVGGAGGDTSGNAVKAQVFAADGSPVGSEIRVNTATANAQFAPDITALSDGGFVVTWLDLSLGAGGAGGDASGHAVKAQVFAPGGTPVGGEILVNTATANSQSRPQITALSDGGFAVTWIDYSQGAGGAAGDASVSAVKAQVFAADGAPVGTEILVNTATTGDQVDPEITALPNGGFVVAWVDLSLGVGGMGGDASGLAVKAQVFAADGSRVGSEVLVNTTTAGNQRALQITTLPDGGFVVTWQDDGETSGDTSGLAVRAQVFAVTEDPVLAGAGGSVSFTEGSGVASTPVAAVPGITVADGDSATLASAQVSITGGFEASEDVLALPATSGIGNIVASYDPATGVLTLTSAGAAATLAEWQAALRAVTYTNSSNSPDTTSRTLSVVANDGVEDSVAVTQTVTVAASNDAPAGADDTVALGFGAARVLTAADFGFSDTDGDVLAAVRIASLPTSGTLQLNGVAVTAGQSVSAADIAGGLLAFTPSAAGAASFTFQVRDDGGVANGGLDLDATANTLTFNVAAAPPPPPPREIPTLGGEGGDLAMLSSGDNSYAGGGGADLILGLGGDDVLQGNMGADSLEGGAGDDVVYGGRDDDLVDGGADDDWLYGDLGNDQVLGGSGDDVIQGGAGNDLCEGGEGADIVRGGQGADTVQGGAGNDWLSGDLGDDVLTGGLGADVFHIFAGAGIDRVTDFSVSDGDRVQLLPGATFTLSQVDADTVVDLGTARLVLQNVQLASLPEGWIFGA